MLRFGKATMASRWTSVPWAGSTKRGNEGQRRNSRQHCSESYTANVRGVDRDRRLEHHKNEELDDPSTDQDRPPEVTLCALTEPRDLQSVNLALGDQRKSR
jgi:hypothetical protein